MHFHFSTWRTSSFSGRTLSASSSSSSLDSTLRSMTVPMGPREDDYNMSQKQQEARLLAKCKRAQTAPFNDAKPLPVRG